MGLSPSGGSYMELKVDLTEVKLVEQKKVRTYGVEIECQVRERIWTNEVGAELQRQLVAMGNNIGSDGSIAHRDGHRGIELRTPALSPKLFEKHIQETCALLAKAEAKTDKSCGLHIHIGNHPADYHYIIAVCEFMRKFEPDIYSMLPPSRKSNSYCMKMDSRFWEQTHDLRTLKNLEGLKTNFYGQGNLSNAKSHGNGKRYYGCNIHSLFYRGTIEFRYHSGTVEPQKIINWQKMADGIFSFVQANYKDVNIFEKKMASAPSLPRLLHKEGHITYAVLDYLEKRMKKFNKKEDPIKTMNQLFEIEGTNELPCIDGRLVQRQDGSMIVMNHNVHAIIPVVTVKRLHDEVGPEWFKSYFVVGITDKNIMLRSPRGDDKRIKLG